MFRNAMVRAAWGMALSLFTIRIEGLPDILSYLGLLLLVGTAWQFALENRSWKRACHAGVVLLIFHSIRIAVSALSGYTEAISIVVFFAGNLLWLIFFYHFFRGLRQMAEKIDDSILAHRYARCFWLYFILQIPYAFLILLPELVYFILPYLIVLLIYIPVQISHLKNAASAAMATQDAKSSEESEQAGETIPFALRGYSRKLWLQFSAYILLSSVLLTGMLAFANKPSIDQIPYQQADQKMLFPEEVAEIRRRLQEEMPFPTEVLQDLPDREVIWYEEASDVSAEMHSFQIDGGQLQITHCTIYYSEPSASGKTRQLLHYRWVTPPRHQYRDTVVIQTYRNIAGGQNLNAQSLYDLDGKTYMLPKEGRLSVFSYDGNYLQFSLAKGKNQRGFLAYNQYLREDQVGLTYEFLVDYYHQKSFWNVPYTDPVDVAQALNESDNRGDFFAEPSWDFSIIFEKQVFHSSFFKAEQ